MFRQIQAFLLPSPILRFEFGPVITQRLFQDNGKGLKSGSRFVSASFFLFLGIAPVDIIHTMVGSSLIYEIPWLAACLGFALFSFLFLFRHLPQHDQAFSKHTRKLESNLGVVVKTPREKSAVSYGACLSLVHEHRMQGRETIMWNLSPLHTFK